MWKTIAALALMLMICTAGVADAKPLTLNQVLEATCRVGATGAFGSGTCIDYKDGKYIILTNAHVVGESKTVRLEFFKHGRKTYPIPANVIWKRHEQRTTLDFALVEVDAKYFGQYPPRIIPLAPKETELKTGAYILSAGCPSARWATAWQGFITSNEGHRLIFHPPPIGGQSGSGLHTLIEIDGEYETRLAAVVTWRIGREGRDSRGFQVAKGGAIPVKNLYNALEGNAAAPTKVPHNWKEIATPTLRPAALGDFAVDTYGRYWRQSYGEDGKPYILMPQGDIDKGVTIRYWNVQCPDGGCPPGGNGPFGPFRNDPYGPRPDRPDRPDRNPGPQPLPPGGGNDGENPFGDLPQLPDSEEDGKLKEENDKLKADITTLENQIKKLQSELSAALADRDSITAKLNRKLQDLQDAEAKLGMLKQRYDKLSANAVQERQRLAGQISNLESSLEDKKATVDNLQTQLEENQNQITDLGNTIHGLQNNNQQLSDENSALNNENATVSSQRDWLGGLSGLLGVGVLSYMGFGLYRRYVRPRLHKHLDNVEDHVEKKLAGVIGEDSAAAIRGLVERLEDRLSNIIDERFGKATPREETDGLRDALSNVKGDLLHLHSIVQESNSNTVDEQGLLDKIEDGLNKAQDLFDHKIQEAIEDIPEPKDNLDAVADLLRQLESTLVSHIEKLPEPTAVATTVINNDKSRRSRRTQKRRKKKDEQIVDESLLVPEGYAKEFMRLKKADGESIEQWALFASLYKDAIKELRHGTLYYKGKTKLQGQTKTADKIDSWVEDEFLYRSTLQDLQDGSKLHQQAFVGFLYKEAVKELRSGRFNVLGAEETANAIEQWVRKELLRRKGVKL